MTYRDEAQKNLINELRKVPQYNEIYIEKDFNGFTRPYFNLHEKLDLLEGIVNKAKSIDVNAALPLYLDDFTDFDNYQVKFKDQYLDLFLYINETYNYWYNRKFSYKNGDIKVIYACVESFAKNLIYLFYESRLLTEVDIIAKNVEYVSWAFGYCSSLKTIRGVIGSKDKPCQSADSSFIDVFINEEVDLSNFMCYIDNVECMFYQSNSPTSPLGVFDPSFLKNWKCITNAKGVFLYRSKIRKINTKIFPSSVTNVFRAFGSCKDLEQVVGNWNPNNLNNKEGFEIPEKVIDSSVLFGSCEKLKSVKNLKLVGNCNSMFADCLLLKEIINLQLNMKCTWMFEMCPINESWKIWLPTEIKTNEIPPYDKNNFLKTYISPDKLKTFYVDINSVTIDGVQEPNIEKRKKQYEDLLNPNRDFIFKFIDLTASQEPPITPPIVVSSDNGHCVFKNTAVYYK